jgi:hypothetical protein
MTNDRDSNSKAIGERCSSNNAFRNGKTQAAYLTGLSDHEFTPDDKFEQILSNAFNKKTQPLAGSTNQVETYSFQP